MRARILLLLFPFLFLGSLPVAAQSWEGLRGLTAGDRIRVRDTDGRERTGKFVSASASGLSLQTGDGSVVLERSRVQRVQVASSARRLRNTLIGVGIGVAVGVTVDQTLGVRLRNEGGDGGRAITYIAPIGIFGALGAARTSWRTVYRVP